MHVRPVEGLGDEIFLMFIFFYFERWGKGREREREREGERESQVGSKLSTEPDVGLDLMTDHEIKT